MTVVWYFWHVQCPKKQNNQRQTSRFFDRMDNVEPGRGTDERVVEVLMGFLDQLPRFPVPHAHRHEERLERWKQDVIVHPRKLPDAQCDGV